MIYALSWLFVTALLALWSFATWALHALAIWTVSSAGSLPGAASGITAIPLPGWLPYWVPPEFVQPLTQFVASLGPATASVLQAVPALAGGLTVAAWVVWGIGALLLLMLGIGLHLLIALWHRRAGGGPGTNGSPLRAAT